MDSRATFEKHTTSSAPLPGSECVQCLTKLAWLPIPVFIASGAILYVFDDHGPHESSHLATALNFVFSTLVSVFIAYLAGRSFLVRGSPGLLMLGCGMVAWGASGPLGSALVTRSVNEAVTVHNILVWLSAACHLTGATLAMRPGRRVHATSIWIAGSYAIAMGAVGLAAEAAVGRWIPPFFVQGEGGTPLRQFVLGSAIAMFSLTAFLLWAGSRRRPSPFSSWYSLGLVLIAIGLLAVWVEWSVGSPLSWMGRAAQMLGSVYLLVAATAAVREARVWEIPLEQALREKEAELELILNRTPFMLTRCGRDLRYRYVSSAYAEMVGRTPEEIAGRPMVEILGEQVFATIRPHVEAVLQGETVQFEAEIPFLGVSPRWLRVVYRPDRDAQEMVIGWIGSIVDITERKRADDALLASEHDLAHAQAVAHIGSWRLDVRYNQLHWSDETYRIFGIARGTPLARETFLACVHPDDRRLIDKAWERALRGEPYYTEHRIIVGGEVKWVFERAQLEFDRDGGLAGAFGTVQDITERRRAEEELRRLNETLEERVAERTALAEQQAAQLRVLAAELTRAEESERRRISFVLHEQLQQLLVAVRLRLALGRRNADAEPLRPMFDELEELVNQAISESRLLTVELSPPVLYAEGLAAGLEWLARHTKEKHGLSIEVHARKGAEPIDEDIQLFLFHAVRELVLNIVKHAQADSARIDLSRTDDQRLRLVVADQGVGIAPSRLESFGTSSGFGLFSIRERLKVVGGSFHVDSTPGQGTRIVIEAPVSSDRRSLEKAAPTAQDEGPGAADSGPLRDGRAVLASKAVRVLIVDDHSIVRQGLAELLSGHPGVAVIGMAANGREAVERALRYRPDVVLMDVSMPVMDGIEATRRIVQSLPQVRVIGLSMHEGPTVASAMCRAGAVGYLPKDSASEAVLDAILVERPA